MQNELNLNDIIYNLKYIYIYIYILSVSYCWIKQENKETTISWRLGFLELETTIIKPDMCVCVCVCVCVCCVQITPNITLSNVTPLLKYMLYMFLTFMPFFMSIACYLLFNP